jgi:hypothetical protein
VLGGCKSLRVPCNAASGNCRAATMRRPAGASHLADLPFYWVLVAFELRLGTNCESDQLLSWRRNMRANPFNFNRANSPDA